MKLKYKEKTTIISGLAFIVIGLLFLSKNTAMAISLILTGAIIDAFGVIGEVKDEAKKSNT
jgi:hypothetical protein